MYNLLKKNFIFCILVCGIFCCNSSSIAQENSLDIDAKTTLQQEEIPQKMEETKEFQNKIIRVLISNNGLFEQNEVILSAKDEIFISEDNNLITNSTSPVKITSNGYDFLIQTQGIIKKIPINKSLIVSSKDNLISINNIYKVGAISNYKGEIEILPAKSNKLKIINIIDIEDYIRGVVPNEMPVSFGLEALKAQAITARGYAYRDKTLKTSGYDVCDTTSSQVYNGYNSYKALSDEAVEKTMGQFALYNSEIILSLYSSTSGGHTENYENVFSKNGLETKFPSDPIPYLKGVADNEYNLDLSEEETARAFYSTKPQSFEEASGKFRWEYAWTIEELENILAKNLIKFSTSEFVQPKLQSKEAFGKIQNIDIPKRGVSGKAMYVRITTDKGVFLIAREIMIRRIFEYNKKWLPSANIVFSRILDGEKLVGYKVIGGGFGHGVGMSQYGASGMAKKGYSYDEILKHYYQGISIGSYPVDCDLKKLNNCKVSFFAPDKNISLILHYEKKPHDLTFKINDSKILVASKDFDKKSGQVNIKKWVKKGINSIELIDYDYGLLDFSDHKVRFYAKLEGQKDE